MAWRGWKTPCNGTAWTATRQVTDAVGVPTAAGEELYLWEGFREMIEKRAVDIIHPDLLTSGGMLETKKIADYAERYSLPTALHFAGSPIAFMANLHTAAAIPSFVALEHHGLDLPFWEGLVTGLPKNYIEDGYVAVPDKPGLGVDLDLEGIEANLRPAACLSRLTHGTRPSWAFGSRISGGTSNAQRHRQIRSGLHHSGPRCSGYADHLSGHAAAQPAGDV